MTIIEVMFAVVILSGVMLALSRFGTAFAKASREAAAMGIASDLATARLEVIRAYPVYDDLLTEFDGAEADSTANPSLSGFPDYTRSTTVTPRVIVSGADTVAEYTTVTVTVTSGQLSRTVTKSVDIARP
jgi:Tfp pilus assembly protein PilV